LASLERLTPFAGGIFFRNPGIAGCGSRESMVNLLPPSMKRLLPALLGILVLSLPPTASAQIPQHLNYQGRVAVQGVNFNGTGQFKFALVDAGENQNVTAQGSAFIAGDAVAGVTVAPQGSGYVTPPEVTFGGPGIGAAGTAIVTNGAVTGITMTSGGSGYTSVPTVTIAPPPPNLLHNIYWSNAGDLPPGEVPATSVSLPVVNGLYSVALGDTSVPNMTAFNPDIFYTRLFLRVWFDDGVHGLQQITPDQPLGSAPYALHARLAETVPPGSISGFQLADGSVSSTKMGLGAALANLQASGQSGVPSGAMLLSANANDPNLVNAGYVQVAATRTGDVWTTHTGLDSSAPSGRYFGTAIWTGSEMIVWGGHRAGGGVFVYGDGGRYDPVSDTWTPIPASLPNSPSQRWLHTAVWTGSEMIVWGGVPGFTGATEYLRDGARYNPTTNSWTSIPATLPNTPAPSQWHSAVWTGSEMIVFGSSTGSAQDLTFGRYSPATHQWASVNFAAPNIPRQRARHAMVWTGSEMILWGGYGGAYGSVNNSVLADGGRYQPATDTWVSLPAGMPGAPSARENHTAVWTGSEMIVWGGQSGASDRGDGARFNPATGTWTPLPASLPQTPSARKEHTAIWTGAEMIVWGGIVDPSSSVSNTLSTGGRYDPVQNRWFAINDKTAPRSIHRAVWTGSEMLVWGNSGLFTTTPDTVARYLPARELFLYQRP
jgi:N-acetylneuraminic acid mutarotase